VAQGRAAWVEVGVSIRFHRVGPPRLSAQKAANASRYWYDRAAHTGIAKLSELASLPMVAPGLLLSFGKRKGAGRHIFRAIQGR
jgi:hypothetical protein